MLRSMYSGISGMRGFQTKLDVIGNNIANVNTVGFKKGRVMFQDILSQNIQGAGAPGEEGKGGTNPTQVGLGAKIGSIDTVFNAGSPMTTNLPTDLSIEGEGFFVVSDGTQSFFTRSGNFTRDANGLLLNAQGLAVQAAGGGNITISRQEYTSYSIGQDGKVIGVTPEGDLEEIATIGVMSFNNPGGLKKIGNSLYEYTVNAGDVNDGDPYTPLEPTADNIKVSIIAGQLEMSNVDLSEEFTEMIVAQRGFQANSRIITTSDSVLEELVNLKR
ncbi:flagellar basal-body rod protein FlgG [Brevibacillus reuszeri]|uniref:flagellar basal body rod protein FlgG n=1 Tax=Brevibacillus reuszeri TaxID=54915 RepID=UPI001B1B06DB|nr:flagellar basal body rod protein FlgG [Brevibacillus reuszeri]GIO06156.1 flagellar basal-body rod protein FlgG [Brevibacillus reuszeri]